MRQQLRNIKNENLPERPKTVKGIREMFQDENILKQYGYTLDNQRRLYFDTILGKSHSFSIFGSTAAIEFVKEHIPPGTRNYLLDGTFNIVPRCFYQLLTIAIEYKNDVCSIFLINYNFYMCVSLFVSLYVNLFIRLYMKCISW